jgi:carbonic anhydrase
LESCSRQHFNEGNSQVPDTTDSSSVNPERLDLPGQGLTREEAFQRILQGHWRYLQNTRQSTQTTHEDRQRHAQGQYPFAAILGCADSRVSPEVIFDQGQGDLFVVRVAGNVAGEFEQASLEYAVQHLGVRLIIVMGHEHCGAVKAALSCEHVPGAIGKLLEEIIPAVVKAETMPGDLLDNAIRCNVCHTVDMLLANSSCIREMVENGTLRVIGLVYDLASGDLDFQRTEG